MSGFEEYYKNSEWFGTYESDLMMKEAFEAGQQSMQAKVEELEGKLKQAYEDVDTFAEAHERECGFKAQLAKDKAELQKRVDSALAVLTEYYTGSYDESPDLVVDIEQALKGEGQ